MFEHFLAMVKNWAVTTTERQKLQHSYLILIVATTLTAGVVSFLDADKGHQVMFVVIVMAIAFLANALVWNVLNSAVLGKITPTPALRRKK